MVQEVNESNYKGIISSNDVVVIKFWAEWCGPCKALAPQFEKLSEESSAMFCSMCVDENPDASDECAVKAIPLIIVYAKGEESERFIGSNYISELKSHLATLHFGEEE